MRQLKKSDSEDSTKAKTESSSEEEKTAEEVETDSDGHVVAVDTDDITKYVTLGDYKNLSVKVPKTEVTDDSISEYINEQLTYKPEEITEDRAVQENDTVILIIPDIWMEKNFLEVQRQILTF